MLQGLLARGEGGFLPGGRREPRRAVGEGREPDLGAHSHPLVASLGRQVGETELVQVGDHGAGMGVWPGRGER